MRKADLNLPSSNTAIGSCERVKRRRSGSIFDSLWPKSEDKYLVESSVSYPVSFNGKVRFTLTLPKDMSKEDVEKAVMQNEETAKYLTGTPKRVIIVPGKIVNIVL